MALTTYTELKTSIANWLDRSDLTTEIADDFIKFYSAGNVGGTSNAQLPGMQYVTDVRGNQIIDPNLSIEPSEHGGEKKLKRYAVPFYTGKMGG